MALSEKTIAEMRAGAEALAEHAGAHGIDAAYTVVHLGKETFDDVNAELTGAWPSEVLVARIAMALAAGQDKVTDEAAQEIVSYMVVTDQYVLADGTHVDGTEVRDALPVGVRLGARYVKP